MRDQADSDASVEVTAGGEAGGRGGGKRDDVAGLLRTSNKENFEDSTMLQNKIDKVDPRDQDMHMEKSAIFSLTVSICEHEPAGEDEVTSDARKVSLQENAKRSASMRVKMYIFVS